MRGLATLLFALAFASAARCDNLMTGSWYTEGVEGGQHLQSIVDNSPDGTFTKHIRNGTDCQAIASWVETGTWTFDGKEYVEVTEIAAPVDKLSELVPPTNELPTMREP